MLKVNNTPAHVKVTAVTPIFAVTCSPASAGITVTVKRGSTTLTGVTDSDGYTEIGITSFGKWTVSAEINGDTVEETVAVSEVTAYAVTLTGAAPPSVAHIYGVTWDGSSSTVLSRTDDALLFVDPVPAVSATDAGSSPFDSLPPWSDMTIVEDSEAGTLVQIPKFWYKLTKDDNALSIQISDAEQEGFSVSPAHSDRGDGKGERNYVYIGRYHCAATSYKSTIGEKPQVNITRSTARTAIHNLGSTIWQTDFAMRFTIWLLYIVEFANWNSQATIGRGCSQTTATSSAVFESGGTAGMAYHTGTVSGSHSAYGVCQYRNIEGLWDNCFDWMDGCYYDSNGMNIILNPANFSDNENGTSIGKPTSGYPSALGTSSTVFPMFYPTTSDGSNATCVPDDWGFGLYGHCPCSGGYYHKSLLCGLFCVDYSVATGSDDYIGARLQKLP